MDFSIASYGGGTNSTAMLIGMVMKGWPTPYAILFADTGGEKPETYDYLAIFSEWLVRQGYPAITIVRKVTQNGEILTLEQDCLNRAAVPSVAYGFKSCSDKYKIKPQEKWANNNPDCKSEWQAGRTITKLIGFDAGEPWRATEAPNPKKYSNRFPLIEWQWRRKECIEAIENCQLPLPGKSACFFCPNAGSQEVLALARNHPDLMDRALHMEASANLTDIKGLGRGQFAWSDIVRQGDMFEGFAPSSQACGCYDG